MNGEITPSEHEKQRLSVKAEDVVDFADASFSGPRAAAQPGRTREVQAAANDMEWRADRSTAPAPETMQPDSASAMSADEAKFAADRYFGRLNRYESVILECSDGICLQIRYGNIFFPLRQQGAGDVWKYESICGNGVTGPLMEGLAAARKDMMSFG